MSCPGFEKVSSSATSSNGTVHFALSGPDATTVAESIGSEQSVVQFVAAQAATNPKRLALAAGGKTLTYGELDGRSDRLARYLRTLGIGPEIAVGVCLDRCPDLVVGLLGILKAGGAYIPLDPAHPSERLAFMLSDSEAPVLVTHEAWAERLVGHWKVVSLEPACARPTTHTVADMRVDSCVSLGSLAYVVYTSGSTGQPKGVQITHESLSNLVFWHIQAFCVTPEDRASQLSALGFDAAVWEVWPYLVAGASLHFPHDAIRTTPELLRDWLVAQAVTISFIPTPLAERVMELEWPPATALRTLLTGGDVLHRYPRPGLPFTVVNNYGPTECTVVATSGPVPPSAGTPDKPSIGRPIANTEVHILDESMNPVPAGVVGELYIGGRGLARGYVGRPDLTSAKFVPDKFSGKPGVRLYRTGDLGCYVPSGDIAFRGRIDDQIKIRGYRIEPNEIITALSRHAGVAASAVAVQEDAWGEKQLTAYVVPSQGEHPTGSELRQLVRKQLPEQMVPSLFVQLEALPLTPNGKIDRRALPCPHSGNLLRDQFVAPNTAIQEHLLVILRSLLRMQDVSLSDNFFLIGGHSLLGAQLIAKVREIFGVNLSLLKLFENGTVAEMASEIDRLVLERRETPDMSREFSVGSYEL